MKVIQKICVWYIFQNQNFLNGEINKQALVTIYPGVYYIRMADIKIILSYIELWLMNINYE